MRLQPPGLIKSGGNGNEVSSGPISQRPQSKNEGHPHDIKVEPWICADVGALESYGKTDSNRDRRAVLSSSRECPEPLASRLVPLRGSDLAGSYYNRNDFL